MHEEISNALAEIEIATKNYRRRAKREIKKWGPIFVGYVVLSVYIGMTYPQLFAGWLILSITVMLLPTMIFVASVYSYIWPYSLEERAFKKTANVAEILSQKNKALAYEEAYQCLAEVFQILKKIRRVELFWYRETNETIARFVENFELVVLPATSGQSMKKEHLEQVALAIYSGDPSKIKTINEALESSYKKEQKPPKKPVLSLKAVSESKVGNLLISLFLGFGLVFVLCLVYVFLTQQDLATFARDRPDIILLGGLLVSGITFWRSTKK